MGRPGLFCWLFFGAAALLPESAFGSLIFVQDDFNDGVIDSLNWDVVIGTNANIGSPSVVESGGVLTLTSRGYLTTADEYRPLDPAVGGLMIAGSWTFHESSDFLQILTRSDGIPAGDYGETNRGIEFYARSDNDTMQIRSRGLNISAIGAVAFPTLQTNEPYDFVIMDDGYNLSFSLTRRSVPSETVTLTTTSTADPSANLIVFHDRESSYRSSSIDDIIISSLTIIPEPSSALSVALLVAGSLLGRRGRRRLS